jgi:prevent-host-death family protein
MTLISVSEASQNLSHWINQASYGRECVIVTSRGRAKAVLIGVPEKMREPARAVDQLRREFHQALIEAGYGTSDQIVELVREVKRELADERAEIR